MPDGASPRPGTQTGVVDAIGQEVRRVFSGIDISGFRVSALAALDQAAYVPRFGSDNYRRRVDLECGETTAMRSWVVFLNFPAAPDASFAPAVAYFARTSEGWCLWFHYFPNKVGVRSVNQLLAESLCYVKPDHGAHGAWRLFEA
jgi:hypothetical protein